ncbi:RNA polymerase sigma-70 factor [Flavitalea sp. BT771]|uniref:RNA polymerase sigma factor n=1 Tax=Flavitalea sp. BT771 TaxID=3063329 RepID=UPI0026E2E72A|nr:RNA polymerase sigma-70 factor [Flavitalea sp. BT771]MDO6429636.1 RNA polymerase sigma-70 factor [Flavitalea sp. BT771]MDV6218236.1 RNA polymerase sigma-70 factor [Flavitalea sp. BT771]
MSKDQVQEEQALVRRMGEGDHHAFNEVFSLLYQRITYMVVRLVGDEDDAKDILAEVFVKLWNKRTDFPSLSAMKSFLYISARNRCLDHLKTKKRREASKNSYAYWMDHPEEVSSLVVNAELVAQLEREIQALPAKCREIVQLAYYEGLSSGQIAQRLGISIQTVWNQKTTAMNKLRAAFLRNGMAGVWLAGYLSLLEFLKK